MLEVVILAAGKGTRMRSNKPKVLHTLANKPFLNHVIDTALQLKPAKIHVIVGHESDQVIRSINNDYAEVECQFNFVEQKEQLGTGHAVQTVSPCLKDNSKTLILYGDVPLITVATLVDLMSHVADNSMGLLTAKYSDPTGYGRIIRNEQNHVAAIVEQKDASYEQLRVSEVNSGVMAFNTAHLLEWLPKLSNDNAQKEYYLTDLVAISHAQNVLVKTTMPEFEYEVLGVNNRVQQAQLERILQKNTANRLLNEGVTLVDPDRFDCRGELSVASDCFIDINCIFEGEVTLGNNVTIGPNCVIKNSNIADNCVIEANSMIDQSTLEEHVTIGPFARIRPNTLLKRDAKIGNFVETKKSIIGEGSKVNHLSYIGDAKVGKNVNIGAGTITCNYDGVNKSLTEIDDDAFVGSNTALVAPVKIGKKATVGAGTVVTSAVPANKLSVARAKQRVIEGWERPTKKQ